MSRAIEAEFVKLRAAAAKIPKGSPGYGRSLEILLGLKVWTDMASSLSHHEALLAVRTARERMEKIVVAGE